MDTDGPQTSSLPAEALPSSGRRMLSHCLLPGTQNRNRFQPPEGLRQPWPGKATHQLPFPSSSLKRPQAFTGHGAHTGAACLSNQHLEVAPFLELFTILFGHV